MICGTWIRTECEAEIACEECMCCASHCRCKNDSIYNLPNAALDWPYLGHVAALVSLIAATWIVRMP